MHTLRSPCSRSLSRMYCSARATSVRVSIAAHASHSNSCCAGGGDCLSPCGLDVARVLAAPTLLAETSALWGQRDPSWRGLTSCCCCCCCCCDCCCCCSWTPACAKGDLENFTEWSLLPTTVQPPAPAAPAPAPVLQPPAPVLLQSVTPSAPPTPAPVLPPPPAPALLPAMTPSALPAPAPALPPTVTPPTPPAPELLPERLFCCIASSCCAASSCCRIM